MQPLLLYPLKHEVLGCAGCVKGHVVILWLQKPRRPEVHGIPRRGWGWVQGASLRRL